MSSIMKLTTLAIRIGRVLGSLLGMIPGWYMILVEPIARRCSRHEMVMSRSGARMSLDLSEFIERKHFFRSYERSEIAFLHRYLRPGDTTIDVGANVGVLAIEAAMRTRARVIAIEPIPSNLERLRANVDINESAQIDIVACAAGQRAGILSIGITASQNAMHNSGSYSAGATESVVQVPVELLDTIVEHRIAETDRIRLLKIDVEGMEVDVILGGSELFEKRRVDAVMFEWNAALSTTSAADVLRPYGFEILELGHFGRLRPASHKLTRAAPRRPLPDWGPVTTIVSWLRGDTRLYTMVALLPGTRA